KKYKNKVFANTPTGFHAFLLWLAPYGPCHICMEATGAYSLPLATYLYDAGYPVSVENAARIHAFGQSELIRNKTDKGDAKMIARYCHLHKPPEWKPVPVNERKLQVLINRLNTLKEMKRMEENRALTSETIVQDSIQKVIAALDEEIKEIEQAIKKHIDNDPDLKKNQALLESIPGVGEILSTTLLGYVGDMSRFSSNKALVAYAGLNPMLKESGCWKGSTKLSKKGNALLRKALYMPAITALKYNPVVAALCNRLKEKGKRGKCLVCAAMKKLLQLAYGVLKSGKPF
ncbi:IS110 family transposase, partial [Yersinia enterocolitica]